jgi:hypothetical protein
VQCNGVSDTIISVVFSYFKSLKAVQSFTKILRPTFDVMVSFSWRNEALAGFTALAWLVFWVCGDSAIAAGYV